MVVRSKAERWDDSQDAQLVRRIHGGCAREFAAILSIKRRFTIIVRAGITKRW